SLPTTPGAPTAPATAACTHSAARTRPGTRTLTAPGATTGALGPGGCPDRRRRRWGRGHRRLHLGFGLWLRDHRGDNDRHLHHLRRGRRRRRDKCDQPCPTRSTAATTARLLRRVEEGIAPLHRFLESNADQQP